MPKIAKVPIKRVIRRGQARWRLFIPRILHKSPTDKTKWFKSESAAKAEARSIEAALMMNASGYDMLTLDQKVMIGGLLSRLPNGPHDLKRAVDLFLERHGTQHRSVRQVVQECLQAKVRAHMSQRYIEQLQSNLCIFSRQFGTRDIASITPEEIQAWLTSNEWSPVTQRGKRIDVNTMFNFALARRYVQENPVKAVERPKVSRGAPRILSVEDCERLMSALEAFDRPLIPYIALVLFGGLRPQEALRTRWEYVSSDCITLPAKDTKLNAARLVEFAHLPTLKAWLDLGGDLPPSNLRRRLRAIREATAAGHTRQIRWGSNILRHSFVSYAVPIFGVAKANLLADHSESVMEKHYRALVKEADARRFWNILPKFSAKS